MLLWILLLPRPLLLFPEKTYGQLNLRRCRTALHVDSGSTLSSSCCLCQELHSQKRHSHCQRGQSCGNCRGGKRLPAFLFTCLSVQKYQRMFPSWHKYSAVWLLFTSKKRCTGLARVCSTRDWGRRWDLLLPLTPLKVRWWSQTPVRLSWALWSWVKDYFLKPSWMRALGNLISWVASLPMVGWLKWDDFYGLFHTKTFCDYVILWYHPWIQRTLGPWCHHNSNLLLTANQTQFSGYSCSLLCAIVNVLIQCHQNAQVEDKATTSLASRLCWGMHSHPPPVWEDKSITYTCIYAIISRHHLSLYFRWKTKSPDSLSYQFLELQSL